jgi:integrase
MSGVPGMIAVDYKYVYRDVDRHGNVRIYFWRKGAPKVRMRVTPGTEAFQRLYDDLMRQVEAGAAFGALDPRTQKARRRLLEDTFREPTAPGAPTLFADFPIGRMTAKAVRLLRDRKSDYPEAGNGRLKAIRVMFTWAISEEIDGVIANPARDVPPLKGRQGGFHSWTDDEIGQFEKHHPIGSRARLALDLLLYTGLRRSDVVLVGRQHIRQGILRMTLQKNRRRTPSTIEVPILPALQRVIDASPTGDLTFLTTRFGRSFTVDSFGNWFRMKCNDAGLPHCSAHGLRKAAAVRAAENGATTHQLMAIFGWLTGNEAERYTKAAQRKRMAADAMHMLGRGEIGNESFPPAAQCVSHHTKSR